MRIAGFSLSEPLPSSFGTGSAFAIGPRTTEFAALFRLMSGSCSITNLNSDVTVSPNQNYFFSDFRENPEQDLAFLDNFEEDITLQDYESHVSGKGFSNRKFYKSLLAELCGAVFNEAIDSHTAAFVHLYRAYEHLSYAFPMIYAAKTDNYIGTFENLRKWISNSDSDGNVGELRFHKSFVSTLFHGLPELSSTIDIHIQSRDEYKEAIFEGLAIKVLGWKRPEHYTGATTRPDKLSISFSDFHSFIVNLRNRYFHYSNSRSDNIVLEEIVESDLLFSFVNKAGMNYITTIFNGVVGHQMEARLT
jgi:hypothetical protein